jgi:hypothetical protein
MAEHLYVLFFSRHLPRDSISTHLLCIGSQILSIQLEGNWSHIMYVDIDVTPC